MVNFYAGPPPPPEVRSCYWKSCLIRPLASGPPPVQEEICHGLGLAALPLLRACWGVPEPLERSATQAGWEGRTRAAAPRAPRPRRLHPGALQTPRGVRAVGARPRQVPRRASGSPCVPEAGGVPRRLQPPSRAEPGTAERRAQPLPRSAGRRVPRSPADPSCPALGIARGPQSRLRAPLPRPPPSSPLDLSGSCVRAWRAPPPERFERTSPGRAPHQSAGGANSGTPRAPPRRAPGCTFPPSPPRFPGGAGGESPCVPGRRLSAPRVPCRWEAPGASSVPSDSERRPARRACGGGLATRFSPSGTGVTARRGNKGSHQHRSTTDNFYYSILFIFVSYLAIYLGND